MPLRFIALTDAERRTLLDVMGQLPQVLLEHPKVVKIRKKLRAPDQPRPPKKTGGANDTGAR